MAGKNKGGREIRKPKAPQPKNNASQPSTKGSAAASPAQVPATPRRGH